MPSAVSQICWYIKTLILYKHISSAPNIPMYVADTEDNKICSSGVKLCFEVEEIGISREKNKKS